MITTHSLRGRMALMVGHCAGMVDLVALPVWVGTLISVYRFDPQQAGLLAYNDVFMVVFYMSLGCFAVLCAHIIVGRIQTKKREAAEAVA